jgi:UPF0716 protein FxsA
MKYLLLLFIIMPVMEMWILIEVGSRIGAVPTIGLVLLTAVIGLALLRQQGFSTLLKVNQKMESGEIPAQEMLEGIFLAVGGALLLTPGFVTDAVGFACLIPWSRRWLVKRVIVLPQAGQMDQMEVGGFTFYQSSSFDYSSSQAAGNKSGDGETLEGEFSRETTPVGRDRRLDEDPD